MEHERFVLGLLQLPGVGRKTVSKAIRPSQRIPSNSDEFHVEVIGLGIRRGVTLAETADAWREAEGVLEIAKKTGIAVLAVTRPDFPAWLKSIPDAPVILFVKGNIECIKTPMSVAVIGTREPSEYGRKVAHRFGTRGAEAGCVVVSGLALGCDTEGHRGCLDAGGRAVAVLAHGLDSVYPKDSRKLADEILEKGGCWVSEYSPRTRPQRSYFVERDRLQSGMASGIIVVETDTDGGTMHTVRFAECQGRPVACLEHPVEKAATEKARGNRLLLQEKRAVPLSTAEDLQTFIGNVRSQAARWTELGGTPHEGGKPEATKQPEPDLFSEEKTNGGSPF